MGAEIEKLILLTRKELEKQPFRQYGPQSIFYELKQKGIEPPPVWTIARVLKRNNAVRIKRLTKYLSKGKKYPYDYILCQQMDYIGPRYLYTKLRFYINTLICQDTHFAQAFVYDNYRSETTCKSLINFWKNAGIPDFIQMDNSISFWGSLIRPNAFGKVIKLCLLLGVVPIFIPVREPWRNGIIERFNNTYQSSVLKARQYNSLNELQKTTSDFCQVHNETHHYSTQDGMTPNVLRHKYGYPYKPLDKNYELSDKPMELVEGEIYIIRFIRSDLKFYLFGLSFAVPKELEKEYALGIILTAEHKLKIFKEQDFIVEYTFTLY